MKGLIAFFDILGYQSFLLNNSATESALQVLDLITGTPVAIKKGFGSFWKEKVKTVIEADVSDSLNHLVFSDTVVLTLPYPDKASEDWVKNAIAYMTFFSAHLKIEMFMAGLPLRGVIHQGDFITKETCLAGQGIIEAYRLANSLDFAGLVFSKDLAEKITDYQAHSPIFTTTNYAEYFIPYLTPLTDGREITMLQFNWISFMKKEDIVACRQDIESFVLRAFWSHQKDCARVVDQKVHNTTKLVRKFLIDYKEKS